MPQGSLPIRRALISVSDKEGLIPFAKALAECNIEIISTGGTAEALRHGGVSCVSVHDLTGYPELLGGRVKTLHPAVHAAILAKRSESSHQQALKSHGITPIDLLCVNLYPFEATVSRPAVTEPEAIEQIDIGGPTLIRSGSKNFEYVTVVTSPSQYDDVIANIHENNGNTSRELRRQLATAAFERTSQYDAAISAWLLADHHDELPATLSKTFRRHRSLRYGENPHQKAAAYIDASSPEPGIITAEVLHGRPLSYNNLLDASAAYQAVRDLTCVHQKESAAVIVKHTNPCGAAIADNLSQAFQQAFESDPIAAFGGILALNQPVDKATAKMICEDQKFFEVIVSPDFDNAAQDMLGKRWKNVRLLAVQQSRTSDGAVDLRSISGGVLIQERDAGLADVKQWQHVAGPKPSDETLRTGAFCWTIVKHLKSNAIAIASDGQLLGAGTGQVDRVSACSHAVMKSGDRISSTSSPAVAASDAFFPFPDGPQLLIDAGVNCIIHPGGSKRDHETFDLCDKHGVTCLLTGIRHFRH